MRRVFLLLGLIAGLLLLPSCWKRRTEGFKWYKIALCGSKNLPPSTSLGTFTYLGRGSQAYVFVQEKTGMVLKLFRTERGQFFRVPKVPIYSIYEACHLAFSEAKEETGLIDASMGRASYHVECIGPLGQKRTLFLDNHLFVLQKKATPFAEALFLGYQGGYLEELLDSFLFLVQKRIEKNLRNQDPSVFRNFGFVGKEAIELDFGVYEKGLERFEERTRYTKKVTKWLEEHAPEWVDPWEEKVSLWESCVFASPSSSV